MGPNKKQPMLGIALMLGAMTIIPVLDVLAKMLTSDYPVLQVTWARFVFHTLWLLPLLFWKKLYWWRMPSRPRTQLLRSLMLTLATLFFFGAIQTNPIPNALTMLFVSPLIVAILAPLILNERFDIFIGVGVLLGFVGIVIALQPDAKQFQPSLLLGLGAGVCYALYIISTRQLSLSSPPLLTLFYTALVGAVILSPLVVFVWVTPSSKALLLMAAMGLVAAIGHFLLIKAFVFATASELSPFNYFEIVSATILSYLLFDFLPNKQGFVGLALVIVSGLYVARRTININKNNQRKQEGTIEMP
jgi:drug/metabolite transporter (DMT)-like permease